MHDTICDFPNKVLYGSKLQSHESVAKHTLEELPAIAKGEMHTSQANSGDHDVLGFPVVFFDTAGCEYFEKAASADDDGSKSNENEAVLVKIWVDQLASQIIFLLILIPEHRVISRCPLEFLPTRLLFCLRGRSLMALLVIFFLTVCAGTKPRSLYYPRHYRQNTRSLRLGRSMECKGAKRKLSLSVLCEAMKRYEFIWTVDETHELDARSLERSWFSEGQTSTERCVLIQCSFESVLIHNPLRTVAMTRARRQLVSLRLWTMIVERTCVLSSGAVCNR